MSDVHSITFLDRVEIQAEVLVPLIKAFEVELGMDRARSIASDALQASVREGYANLREKIPGNPIDLISGGIDMFAKDALEYEVIGHSSEAFDFNVIKCAYAEFYKALGEPELGFLFVCDLDNAIAEGLGPDLEFRQTQTIMQGAGHCDFRYRRREKG
jgi:hypothetical protein